MPKASDKDKGPKPVEIAIAAVLSLIVGVIGAIAFLILQTPERVTQYPDPEDRELGRLYYIEGKAGNTTHDTWQPKESALKLARSGRITLVEEEINRWAAQNLKSEEGDDDGFISMQPGVPRFRIADDLLTVQLPLTWTAFGTSEKFDAQVSGQFVEQGGRHVFKRERVYIASCPLPGPLANRVYRDAFSIFDVSQELRNGWAALERVELDGDSLKLEIP